MNVLDRLPIVYNKYGIVEAIWAENEENLKLAIDYYSWANGNCCDGFAKIKKTEWRGPDWYFCIYNNIYDDDDGIKCYYLETLTEKKEKFARFCSRFQTHEKEDTK